MPGRVLSSGEPAWIVDVQYDDNFPRKREAKEVGLRGAFGFPVKIGTETVAVLEFFTTEAREADPDILNIIRTVALQMGRGLERERNRALLVHQAEELNRSNEELEAFSYSVSHDLRAPLRAIDGFSRLLLENETQGRSAQDQHYLDMVRTSTKQMGQLIDDLLSFSRLSRQPLRPRSVSPGPLVRQVLEELQSEREGRTVELTVGKLPKCQADSSLLKQIFVNLISNALKYTRERDPAVIEIGCQQEGGKFVYYVKDNGVGFDMRYADNLFGVFQRLHRAEDFEGTGVGLAIVQRIVHRHGGNVWAEAEVNEGATFFFTLREGESSESSS